MRNEVVERYYALFEGCEDQYALGGPKPDQPWKFRYSKRMEPLTLDVVEQHLRGELTVGVYCEREGWAKWFCMDFDSPKDADGNPVEGGFNVALAEALEAKSALLKEGLLTHLERSRSGNGIHLWGFIDDWVEARDLARAVYTRVPKSKTLDRGKLYPPLRHSENSILICMPYAGEAVERGGTMFFRQAVPLTPPEIGYAIDDLTLEQFLDEVKINPASVVRELSSTEALPSPANRPDGSVAVGAQSAGQTLVGDFSGRPAKPGSGIVKMLSPFGCGAMRSIMHHQDNPAMVGEPEWYAFLGQLTAFKHGRDAAHSIFSRHKHYNKAGMDQKYDHALQSPPPGCAFIHERFPQHAERCSGCPMKAPYHRGMQSIPELVGESPQELEKALYDKDLERIRRLDSSDEVEGIPLGVPGIDTHFRIAPGEFCAIGAQPSIGKTALAVHIANSVAARGIDVATFSAETGQVTFHDRQLAWRANVDSYALKGMRNQAGAKIRLSKEEWKRIEEARDWLNKQPLWENYTSSSPERIYDAVEAMLCKRGRPLSDPALVLYDYFQYAQGNDEFKPGEEHVRLARASFAFKSITKIINQGLVVFAQLIRESEGDDEPQINWWRGTARLEHDIDSGIIMTGVRMPGLYAPRMATCVKKREGEVGWKVEMMLEQAVSRFVGKPADEKRDANELLNAPWTNTSGQTSLVPPTE